MSLLAGRKVMDGFTLLPFALCAQMTIGMGQDLVELGNVVAGVCDSNLLLGDSHGETAHIKGHDIGVTMFEYGAELWIDGVRFIVPKTQGV